MRWAFAATHTGPLLDMPASGRRVRVQGMTWMRVEDGNITAGAGRFDLHSMLAYLTTGVESATVCSGRRHN